MREAKASPTDVACRVAALMDELNLTQKGIAEEVGVSQSAVCAWTLGQRAPEPLALLIMASLTRDKDASEWFIKASCLRPGAAARLGAVLLGGRWTPGITIELDQATRNALDSLPRRPWGETPAARCQRLLKMALFGAASRNFLEVKEQK